MKKKGISLLISYSILVVIAVALSVLVYSYLKLYTPQERVECLEDTRLIIESATCNGSAVDLTLSNRGFFNVTSAFIRFAPEGRTVLSQINRGKELFITPISPGQSRLLPSLDVSKIVTSDGSYTIEVQPAIFKNREFYLCEGAVITQAVECTAG